MSFRNAFGIYHVIERLLKQSNNVPLTCVDLFESAEVQEHAKDVNAVSDYLGHMWRRKLLNRVPAPPGHGAARWAYTWKDPNLGTPSNVPKQRFAQPKLQVVNLKELENTRALVDAAPGQVLVDRPSFKIIERDGGVVVETLHHTFTILPK